MGRKSNLGSMSLRPGFSLVEMMLAMLMTTIVMAGMIYLFSSSNQAYVAQDEVVTVTQNIRSAMEIMGHELRMAGYISRENQPNGSSPINSDVSGQTWSDGALDQIEEAAASALTFVADLNADGNSETVRYVLNGTNLTRQSWEWNPGSNSWVLQVPGAVNVAENVTGLNFNYTFADGSKGIPDDTDGLDNNDREDVRAVTISMTAQTEVMVKGAVKGASGFRSQTLQTDVQMRNMGLEPTY